MSVARLALLVDRYAASLTLFARQWCSAAEDAVQEAFCKLATAKAWPDDPAAWLYRVTKNAALDAGKAERRRKRRESRVAKSERWFEQSVVEGLDAEQAVDALQHLTPELREVIVMRIWSDLTLEQIAAACGCSVSTAFRRYEAGVEALRQVLAISASGKV